MSPAVPHPSAAGWSSSITSLRGLCTLAVFTLTFNTLSVASKRTCDLSLGTFYPYCVNVPDGASDSDKLPTVLFLSGRGARGSPSDVKTLSTYDGFGKLVNEYESGNTDEVHTLAATKFITIVPVAPTTTGSNLDPQYWYPELLDKVVDAVIAKYPVDEDRFHVAGYSMGAFGSWRYAVHRPDLVASVVPSGGNAEQNSITNSEGETVQPVFGQLGVLASQSMPVRAFAGSQDTTVPPAGAEKTQAEMDSLGDADSTLTIMDTDHSGLSVGPFTAELLSWMLEQKRSSALSSSSSSSSTASSSGNTSTSSATSATSVSSDGGASSTDAAASSASSTEDTSIGSSASSTSSSGKKTCTRRRKRSAGGARLPQHAALRRALTLDQILADRKASRQL